MHACKLSPTKLHTPNPTPILTSDLTSILTSTPPREGAGSSQYTSDEDGLIENNLHGDSDEGQGTSEDDQIPAETPTVDTADHVEKLR